MTLLLAAIAAVQPQDIPNTVRKAPFDVAIKVDQVGYKTGEKKIAVLTAEGTGDAAIYPIGPKVPVLTVPVGAAVDDADSGDKIRHIDFTKLNKPGKYYVEVPGVGKSAVFQIGNDIFARPFRLAIRSFYGQRASTDVDMSPDFPQYKYKKGHAALAQYHESSGKTGNRDVSGGWYDAGDYGRYVVNSGITTGTLLWAFEMNSSKLAKLKLDIPETGKSKIPDFLSEVKYNLDWMLKMQDEDGGAWHKATTAGFAGFVMPEADTAPMLVIGTGRGAFKNTTATADLAAVAAIAARVFKPYDGAYAAKCLAAAEKGFAWAEAHPKEMFNNPRGIATGGYGDGDARDERLWAAAELYRTTGKPEYQSAFLKLAQEWKDTLTAGEAPGWPQVRPMALMTFAMTGHKSVDKAYQKKVLDDLKTAADGIADRVAANPYLMPLRSTDYYWGSNAVVANFAMMLQVADRKFKNPRYRQAALDSLHYLLGRNTFATSFVTHVGSHYAMNPHHRWSGADGIAEPWPGLLMGGPNADNRKSPPAKQWFDDWKDYRTNEIAINWNAPLVFVLSNTL